MAKKSKAAIVHSEVPNPSINVGSSEKDRSAITAGLSRLLADTYTLYLTTHNFHWNVTGPCSTRYMLCSWPSTPSCGTRSTPWRSGFARWVTLRRDRMLIRRVGVDPYAPETPPRALDIVHILKEGQEAVARTARSIFPLADTAGDEPTADL